MSRDKPVMKNVELHTNTFLKSLENVEIGLSKNIQYLTQVSTGMILFPLGKYMCYGNRNRLNCIFHCNVV